MSQKIRFGALVLALTAITVGGMFVAHGDVDAGPTIEPLLRVQTQAAEAGESYEVVRSFIGRVETARESELGFELAGLLAKVWVEEGDVVKRGARVAVLDTERLRSRRDELTAAREQALAHLDLARSTDARVASAAGLNAVSAQEWDEARQGLRVRAAAVKQLEAQISSLEVEIAKSTLRAPFAGVVSVRSVDEGEVLAVGRPVVRLLEAERLEARVGVAAAEASALGVGDALDVVVRGQITDARVKAILPERELATRAVTVLLELRARQGHADGSGAVAAIRSGDLVEITLSRSLAASGFWLPTSALAESVRGLWTCYVVEPRLGDSGGSAAASHEIARRDVEVLHATTDRVYVRGTLRSGEQVIIDGVHRVVPGQPVLLASSKGAVS